jgi:peptidyl-dipeptidase A
MVFLAAVAAGISRAGEPDEDNDARARRFVAWHENTVRPLEVESARRWWAANLSGKDDDYRAKREAETRLDLQLSDRSRFAELKAIREGGVKDKTLAREIEILYLQYLAKQLDPELLRQIVAKANEVEQAFNVYRAKVNGKELSDSEVREVLQKSKDSAYRRAVWEASKAVGPVIEADLRQLVALRNQAAHKLGFQDYHVMQLYLGEQSQEQVLNLFAELDQLTRQPFHQAKAQIDAALAKNYGIAVDQLRPWHYQDPFFQEAPSLGGEELESVYANVDIPRVCRDFYAGIGLPVDDVLARSDLYERSGKNPHAFCTDIDREGDVRVLANIVPNRYWLETMLHELGHAVYSSKNIPRSVPYVLRTESHTLTTEGIAMMFQRFPDQPAWLQAMGIAVPDPRKFEEITTKERRNGLLIFSRWCQVMFRFEKELYANPDQNLNRLWWNLVEEYQEIRRPERRDAPDYAAKIHIASAPAYYHNYMMGELFASQVHHALVREVLGGGDPAKAVYVGNKKAGQFLQQRIFAPGRTLPWNELARRATGEPLNAKAFAEDFRER